MQSPEINVKDVRLEFRIQIPVKKTSVSQNCWCTWQSLFSLELERLRREERPRRELWGMYVFKVSELLLGENGL